MSQFPTQAFSQSTPRVTDPARSAVKITPSDTVDIPTGVRGIYVGVSGDVSLIPIEDKGSTPILFKGLAAGVVHPIAARRIFNTGTTATDIVGLL